MAAARLPARSDPVKSQFFFPMAIDTNHLERALRVIPMGRKNWLFCWTELGARHAGIVQSLLVTFRLHDIDPYDYFVDVLQRVGQHPAKYINSRHGCGSRCSPPILCAPIYTACAVNAITPAGYRLRFNLKTAV